MGHGLAGGPALVAQLGQVDRTGYCGQSVAGRQDEPPLVGVQPIAGQIRRQRRRAVVGRHHGEIEFPDAQGVQRPRGECLSALQPDVGIGVTQRREHTGQQSQRRRLENADADPAGHRAASPFDDRGRAVRRHGRSVARPRRGDQHGRRGRARAAVRRAWIRSASRRRSSLADGSETPYDRRTMRSWGPHEHGSAWRAGKALVNRLAGTGQRHATSDQRARRGRHRSAANSGRQPGPGRPATADRRCVRTGESRPPSTKRSPRSCEIGPGRPWYSVGTARSVGHAS